MGAFNKIYRAFRKVSLIFDEKLSNTLSKFILLGNNVEYGKNLTSKGTPIIDVWKHGICHFGDSFSMNNGSNYNLIGRQQPCMFVVQNNAKLLIGNNVGISSTAIYCSHNITIGNNVKIGGNCVIYDTDFHSLEAEDRADPLRDKLNIRSGKVSIGDNVFIGAHSTILKGVTIGNNSIIGACSLVTKSIPDNEIWGGNPAKLIRII
jgi:acetyltransferase-like isoleucine patch superfamily enzyme